MSEAQQLPSINNCTGQYMIASYKFISNFQVISILYYPETKDPLLYKMIEPP
jgi:hypothetical protein